MSTADQLLPFRPWHLSEEVLAFGGVAEVFGEAPLQVEVHEKNAVAAAGQESAGVGGERGLQDSTLGVDDGDDDGDDALERAALRRTACDAPSLHGQLRTVGRHYLGTSDPSKSPETRPARQLDSPTSVNQLRKLAA